MTTAIDYSYIDFDQRLTVNFNLMNRAVRVKKTVSEKIDRIFKKSLDSISNNLSNSENFDSKKVISSHIDDSEENLFKLNEKLNLLVNQEKVPCVMNRAVLFTQALVNKIEKVNTKWFGNFEILSKKLIKNEVKSSSDIVPGEWQNITSEMQNRESVTSQTDLNNLPSFEPVSLTQNETQSVEVPQFTPETEEAKTDYVPEPTSLNETEVPNAEVPEFTPETEEAKIDYVPEPTSLNETNVPNVEVPEFTPETEEAKIDYVPEPASLNETNVPNVEVPEFTPETEEAKIDYVPEPASLNETNVPNVEVPEVAPRTEEVKTDYVPEPVSLNETEVPSVEVPEFTFETEEAKTDYVPEPASLNTSDVASVEVPEFTPETKEANADYVPEPVSLNETNVPNVEVPEVAPETEEAKPDYVPEPVSLNEPEVPSVEVPGFTAEAEEAKPDLKTMSIEDRIAKLLGKRDAERAEASDRDNSSTEKSATSSSVEPSQSLILAKLRRLNNTMKDKNAEIASLRKKLDEANDSVSTSRDKINGYEAVFRDLTVRYNGLSQENEKLLARVSEAESSSKSTIEKLQLQLSEIQELKAKQEEEHKKAIADLNEKHSREIEELNNKYNAKISEITAASERKVRAIYETISDALGEPVEETSYSKAA